MSGLACSLVTPTDQFHGAGDRNALGCVGVIVGLQGPDSLIAVAPEDLGSWVADGVRQYPEPDLTITDCENSLLKRVGHNEWGVRNYTVLGILAVPPFEIWNHTPPGAPCCTSLDEVKDTFPNLPIITFDSDRNSWDKPLSLVYT